MKQYLLSVYDVDGDAPPAARIETFDLSLQVDGAWVFGGVLHTPDTATVVRSDDGDVVLSDGPFVEAAEQVGRFWVVDAADLDDALGWAAKASAACRRPVEVRPFQDGAGGP